MRKFTKAILSLGLVAVMSIGIATTSMAAVVGYIDGSDGNFLLDGVQYKASEKWKTDGTTVPDGFKEYTLKIGTHTYAELKDASGVVLIYLKPADNTAGKGTFYVLDEAAGSVSSFNYLNGVLVGTPDYVPSSSMTQTTLEVGASQYEAYQLTGSNFYYFYGTDASGLPDWFSYEPNSGNVAKADAVALAMTEPTVIEVPAEVPAQTEVVQPENNYAPVEVYVEKLSSLRKVIIFLIIMCVVLLFIIVNILLSNFAASKEGDVFREAKGSGAKSSPKNASKQPARRTAPPAKTAARPAPERQQMAAPVADGPKLHKASEKRRNDVFPEDNARRVVPQPSNFGAPVQQPDAGVQYPGGGQPVYPGQYSQPQAPAADPEFAPIDISGIGAPSPAPQQGYQQGFVPGQAPAGQPNLGSVYGTPTAPQQGGNNGVIDFNNL